MKKANFYVRTLAKSFDKSERKTNYVLIMTVAIGIIFTFLLISLGLGRTQAEHLRVIQENETTANIILTNATTEQIDSISEIAYVDTSSTEQIIGEWCIGDNCIGRIYVIDEQAYTAFYQSTYKYIEGDFPQTSDEVMLSLDSLHRMGISNPEIDMEISINISCYNWIETGIDTIEGNYRLSGYYESDKNQINSIPKVFLLQDVLPDELINMNQDILIKTNNFWFSENHMREQLCADISLEENQTLQIINIGAVQYWEDIMGNVTLFIGIVLLIQLSLYMFLCNMIAIMSHKKMESYILLKTIGMTPKQLRKFVLHQYYQIILRGSAIGVLGCILLGVTILPRLTSMIYLGNGDALASADLFSVKVLILSVFSICLLLFIAWTRSNRGISQSMPLEIITYKFLQTSGKKKKRRSYGGSVLFLLAWQNVTKHKSRFFITIFSLFLGLQVAIIAIILSTGLDASNEINAMADFEIGVTQEYVQEQLVSASGTEVSEQISISLISDEIIQEISEVSTVSSSNMEMIVAKIGYPGGDEGLQLSSTVRENFISMKDVEFYTLLTTVVASDEEILELEAYAENQGIEIDWDTFKNGYGFIWLDNQPVIIPTSEIAEENEVYGQYLATFENLNFQTFTTECGALITSDKNFPLSDLPWNNENEVTILLSEATYEAIGDSEHTYALRFNVPEGMEVEVGNKLYDLLQELNDDEEIGKSYYMISKLEVLEEANAYIHSTNYIMWGICFLFLFLAIINYCNTIGTSVISQKEQFKTLRDLGMIPKQLLALIFMEGGIYVLGMLTLSVTIGIGSVVVLWRILSTSMSYFVFVFPVVSLLVLLLIILSITFFVPLLYLRKLL